MKTNSTLLLTAIAMLLLSGCDRSRTGAGLYLPRGDAEKDRSAFVDLKCYQCHRVEGVQLPAPTVAQEAIVQLGGEVTRLRSYGDLVTSIIHPAETLAELAGPSKNASPSKHPMKAVNNQMTVEQLVDLVSFLHPHYRLLPPAYDPSLVR